jgi:hypothetical protein
MLRAMPMSFLGRGRDRDDHYLIITVCNAPELQPKAIRTRIGASSELLAMTGIEENLWVGQWLILRFESSV